MTKTATDTVTCSGFFDKPIVQIKLIKLIISLSFCQVLTSKHHQVNDPAGVIIISSVGPISSSCSADKNDELEELPELPPAEL